MLALTLLNPAHQWAKDITNHCVRSGLQAPLSLYEKEGIMPEIHANHVQMVNSITELKAHGHPRPSSQSTIQMILKNI